MFVELCESDYGVRKQWQSKTELKMFDGELLTVAFTLINQ